MVSIGKIINVSGNVQTKKVQNVLKKTTPVVGGLTVLAGAGMSGVDELSHISVSPLPSGADVYNDPLIDQLSYRVSQISDVGANLMDGAADAVGGVAHIASTLGGAAIDGVEFATDCAMAAYTKAIETVVDLLG